MAFIAWLEKLAPLNPKSGCSLLYVNYQIVGGLNPVVVCKPTTLACKWNKQKEFFNLALPVVL